MTQWSSGGKAALCGFAVLIFGSWYALIGGYVLSHPDLAPYVNRPFAQGIMFPIQAWIIVPAWLACSVAALLLRKREAAIRVLLAAMIQLFFGWFALCSYFFGTHTSPFTSLSLLGGTTVALVFFPKRQVVAGLVTFFLIITGTSIAEQLQKIPYAPLLVEAPFKDGRLASTWLWSIGTVDFLVAVCVVGLIYYVVARWHDHEVKLNETTEELARTTDLISRYVAGQVVQQIRSGNYDVVDRHDRRKLTIFFSDIRGFTELADQIEAEDLSRILNEYLAEMADIAERYGATIDKFIGDAIMIFFGAPLATDDRDHALRTTRMAIAMQERMLVLHEKWSQEGIEQPFQIRIGINTGVASVGNFGAKGRMDYTAIGRHVNLASRLQVNCEPGKILLSHATWILLNNEIPCVPKGEVQMKGIRAPVKVYEVVSPAEPPGVAVEAVPAERSIS